MATTHERRRLDSIAKLLNNNQYSDLEVECDERTFYVHKAIVCPAAPFLAAAIKHGFKESKANTIKHEEFDADTVELVLTYIYAQDYGIDHNATGATSSPQQDSDSLSPSGTDVNRRLITHARVYGLADYWGMPELMTLAADKFTSDGKDGPINYGHFVDVIREVHQRSVSGTNELREALRVVRCTHRRKLAGHEDFLKTLINCDEAREYVVETIQELNRTFRQERSVVPLEGVNFGSCRNCGNSVQTLAVDDLGDDGSEQDFAIKCSNCCHEFFRH